MDTKFPILALFLFFSVSHTFADEKQNVIEITEKLWAAAAIKQIALIDCQLDHTFSDYDGERLDLEIRQKLLNI